MHESIQSRGLSLNLAGMISFYEMFSNAAGGLNEPKPFTA
jgi:hypothetical protein